MGSNLSKPSAGERERGPFAAPPGTVETESFHRIQSGEDRTVGGEVGGIAISPLDRMTDTNQVYQHGDARALHINVESIECLEKMFINEFRTADERMRQKTESLFYDYEKDDRFQKWQKDQAAVRERLKIHFLDDLLDHPLEALVYFGRIFTTAGLLFGVGRTGFLYHTMDKAYARLNGVSLASIAAGEVSLAISKGAAVAVAATLGLMLGDTLTSLCTLLWTQDVSLPERTWHHIWCSALWSGAGAGCTFAGLHRAVLTPRKMCAVASAFIASFTGLGAYLGYAVYRPFAERRTHKLYEPYWRPWNSRLVGYGGPHHVRGRYT